MFCVIQEIQTKKPNKHGYPKELKSDFTESNILGRYAWHYYSEERFERPIMKAYRISIHESYREDGKVKKKQFYICTADYYELADGYFTLYDWGDHRIEKAADTLKMDPDEIYDIIQEKLKPLIDRIQNEFALTEEFMTHAEHEKITTIYAAKKAKFNEKYQTTNREYDECYDVYGNLWNPERLKEIKEELKAKKEYEHQSYEQSRGYYDDFFRNYSKSGSSYIGSDCGNYTEEEHDALRKFYRVLSKKFHPDSNPDVDTSEEMKLLNKLKQDWGV